MEGALPGNAGVASLLDQLALVQFLLDRLPEAEASAQRMVELAARMFAGDTAARAMCSLRLGAVLAGELLLQRSVMCRQPLLPSRPEGTVRFMGILGSVLLSICLRGGCTSCVPLASKKCSMLHGHS